MQNWQGLRRAFFWESCILKIAGWGLIFSWYQRRRNGGKILKWKFRNSLIKPPSIPVPHTKENYSIKNFFPPSHQIFSCRVFSNFSKSYNLFPLYFTQKVKLNVVICNVAFRVGLFELFLDDEMISVGTFFSSKSRGMRNHKKFR